MQYQLADGWTSVSFVRPAHGLVALHGGEVVPVRALGLDAGRTTHGHRFEASRTPIELRDADGYATQLRDEGAVIASFDERRAEIRRQLDSAAAAAHLAPIDDDALLDEVTALVERPNVLTCRFDREFLAVPPECLVLTMKANQKYFPLLEARRPAHRPLPRRQQHHAGRPGARSSKATSASSGRAWPTPSSSTTRTASARSSRACPGSTRSSTTASSAARAIASGACARIAAWVAARIGADPALADRAALLAKADLLTDMVGEFPELQGIMGGYYAAHDGEAPEVVAAIRDQYVNRRGDSESATNLVGEALLIADRAETPGRHLGHRREAHRRQGSVCAASPRARR